jgi:hypothetical protein
LPEVILSSSADHYTAYNVKDTGDEGPGPVEYLAVLLAWLVPGMGHLVLRQWGRGIIFFVCIHLLFAGGLLIGGIRCINPPDQAIWTYTQFLSGWPMLVANKLEGQSRSQYTQLLKLYDNQTPDETLEQRQVRTEKFIENHPLFAYHPKVQDLGSVYCGIAGMLNLLVMFDVLLRITGSVREDPAAKKRSPAAPSTPPTAPATPEAAP